MSRTAFAEAGPPKKSKEKRGSAPLGKAEPFPRVSTCGFRGEPHLITALSEGRGYGETGGEGLLSSCKVSASLTHGFAVPPVPQAGEGCCQLIFRSQTKMYKLQRKAEPFRKSGGRAAPSLPILSALPVRWVTLLLTVLFWAASPAYAHVQQGEAIGFLSGLHHPISGLDHVLAMIAVGLWGAQLGAPAVWLLPVCFPMVMAMGGMLGLLGVHVPGIEIGIAASAILLGAAVMPEARPSLMIAAALVAFFAIFHGYAHGTELPAGESGLLYSMGFVFATGCLHGVGNHDWYSPPLDVGTEAAAFGRRWR